MIQTLDILFAHMKRYHVQIDIISNFSSREERKLQFEDTTVSFDFDNSIILIHREPENEHVRFKSPDVTMTFTDYIEICKSFGLESSPEEVVW